MGFLSRRFLVAAMCVALIGCQVSTSPTRVSQLDQHHGVAMMRAPWNGQYTLYLLPPNPKGERKIITSARLRKNDPLGFRQRESGPVAVAGELEVPLADGQYEWVMQADKGQTNWLATAGLVALIVAVAGGIFVAVVAVSVDQALKHFQ